MREMEQSEAMLPEHKFLSIPELIETLISFLDPLSVLRLLQVIDKDILQKSVSYEAWNKLIRRSSYDGAEDVRIFTEIVKILELDEPSTFLLPLLVLICESGPSQRGFSQVSLICPSKSKPRKVTPDTFLLLEEVEGAFGTTVQSIKSIRVAKRKKLEEPLLMATTSRMSRQKEVVTSIKVEGNILINNKGSALALSTLLEAQKVVLSTSSSNTYLKVGGAVGEEGWKELGKFIEKTEGQCVGLSISKEALSEAWHYPDIDVVVEGTYDILKDYQRLT